MEQIQTDIKKIVLIGPESTGKSTLAQQLAIHYKTQWVPEYCRNYFATRWTPTNKTTTLEDVMNVAQGQINEENKLVSLANKLIFCDTNLLMTKLASDIIFNFCDPILLSATKQHYYDLYFLTDIDVPWENDLVRNNTDNRKFFFELCKQELTNKKIHYHLLSGNKELRFKKAVSIIDNMVRISQLKHTNT